MEYAVCGGLLKIDLAVFYKNRTIAIEVDGPHHYTSTKPYYPTGSTNVRNYMLRALGWDVITVCTLPSISTSYQLVWDQGKKRQFISNCFKELSNFT